MPYQLAGNCLSMVNLVMSFDVIPYRRDMKVAWLRLFLKGKLW